MVSFTLLLGLRRTDSGNETRAHRNRQPTMLKNARCPPYESEKVLLAIAMNVGDLFSVHEICKTWVWLHVTAATKPLKFVLIFVYLR